MHTGNIVNAAPRVNAICPGPTLTEGTRRHAASQGKSMDEACKEMTSHMIMPRSVLQPSAYMSMLMCNPALTFHGSAAIHAYLVSRPSCSDGHSDA